MRPIRLLTMLMILFPLGLQAQRTDIIETRDGNKYEGYLARQIPNKSITIVSSRTTITVASRDAETTRVRKKMVGDLPEEAIALFPLLSDDMSVDLADVIVEGWDGQKETYKQSVILEKGEILKFVSFEPRTVELKWSQLKLSAKSPYDFSRKVGFHDHLLLNDANILEGQLMEQDLRSGIFKFRETNGQVTTFHKSDVQAIRFAPADPEADIWEQFPYCDKVNLKDGTSRDGVIVSKVFGKTVELLLYNSSLSETFQARDIESYEKFKNPRFRQKFETPEFVEQLEDLYVNGESRHVCDLRLEKKTYSVSNEIDSLKIRVNAGERVVIKYRANARTSQFCQAKAKLAEEKVFRLSGLKVKNRELEQHPSFSVSDIMNHPDINFQANEGGFIVADFVLDLPGIYVFFVRGSQRCFVIYAQ